MDIVCQAYPEWVSPFLVYTNFGGKNDFMAVKQFATREEADDWIVYQSAERPAYYEVIHQSEFDTGP